MKKALTSFALIFLAKFAIAQCSPSPSFSVSKVFLTNNQPLYAQATITTPMPTWPVVNMNAIDWGDGSTINTSTSANVQYHAYAAPGTYSVKYYLKRFDSSTFTPICYDTVTQSFTIAYCPGASTFSVSYGNQSGKVTVTANNLSTPTSSTTYTWYTTGLSRTGPSFTHVFPTLGPHTLMLVSGVPGCYFDYTQTIYPGLGPCTADTAHFTDSVSGLYVSFRNHSTPGSSRTFHWDFGDGNTSTLENPTHVYSAAGTYLVKLATAWDSTCVDTAYKTYTVYNAGAIWGFLIADSTITPNVIQAKVWLIEHDSIANTLTAIDSVSLTGGPGAGKIEYYFPSTVPVGKYLVKAAITNNPTSGSGVVPTYATSSLSWSSATTLYYYRGYHNVDIIMQNGTLTSGPGFVGGSISMGANKGTGSGIAGIDVFLIDIMTGKLVKSATTDMNGDYSFSSVPTGMYQIQPEWMGFKTTPSVPFTISNTNTKVENIWFLASNSKKTIKPVPASVKNVADGLAFSIYPNPAKSKTTIQWSGNGSADAAVVITDIAGKKVYSNTVDTSAHAEIDLSQLKKGLYFINVSSGNMQQTQKLVVE